jgi:hypothetical protein
MRRFVLFMLLFFSALPLYAAEVKNLKTGQSGDKGVATYDLAGVPGERQADVTVFIELGGVRYPADKLSLSGDFGKGVKVGAGKRIFWDVLKDMPAGFEGEAVWELDASAPPPPVATASGKVGAGSASPMPRQDSGGMEFEKEGFRFYKDVVVDTKTRLMWARNANIADIRMNWNDAMAWAQRLNHAGYRDWRLPTKKELEALTKWAGTSPSDRLNGIGFTGVQSNYYWSSSTNAAGTRSAWNVNLNYGNVYSNSKTNGNYVWPVRAGQ